jgi:hypothetical protein
VKSPEPGVWPGEDLQRTARPGGHARIISHYGMNNVRIFESFGVTFPRFVVLKPVPKRCFPMAKKEHEEFLRLYKPLHERFIRYGSNHAYGLMNPEDLVQETILSTLQHFQSVRDKEKLPGIKTASCIPGAVLIPGRFFEHFENPDHAVGIDT